MNGMDMNALAQVTHELFQTSVGIFWSGLPISLLLALLVIFIRGEISAASFGGLFKRLIIAIALVVAFPKISNTLTSLDHSLVAAFGGDDSIQTLFAKIADRAREVKNTGVSSWIKIGEMGLSLITTVSFIILAIVQKFLDILRMILWNILHILGPLALLALPFRSFDQMSRGIFLSLLEIALWRPVWVILCRLLMAIGFGVIPDDVSKWFDLAIMNFAVAALMVGTPALVHGFLSGTLASVGGTAVQAMAGGVGAAFAGAPLALGKAGARLAQRKIAVPVARRVIVNPANRFAQRFKPSKQSDPEKKRQGQNKFQKHKKE